MLHQKIVYLISHYGYFGLFFSLIFGIIGLPVPDEALLTFAGYLVYKGKLHYVLTCFAAWSGSIIGMSVSYFIGMKLGTYLLKRRAKHTPHEHPKLALVRKWYEKYGNYSLMFGYYVPGVRHFNAYYAGIIGKPYQKFALFAFSGGIIWTISFVTLGIFVGEEWLYWSLLFRKYIFLIAFIIILGAVGYLYYKSNRKMPE